MGDELGSATDADRLLVSSGLSARYTTLHLDRERRFLMLPYRIVGQKCRKKWVILSFLGYLGEFESDSRSVRTCICTVKPRSVLPIFNS